MHGWCFHCGVHSCFELWSTLSQSRWIRRYVSVTHYYYIDIRVIWPDNISAATLKNCTEQLAPVFCDIFNQPLQSSKLLQNVNHHSCPQETENKITKGLPNRCCHIHHNESFWTPCSALPVICYRLSTWPLSVRLQSRQVSGRCSISGPSSVLEHLDSPNTYARIVFIGYSSAFNTIIHEKLFSKLRQLSINSQMCRWILNILLDRPQVVKVNTLLSQPLILSTGAPQGCVLSPLLYSLFTNDCRSNNNSTLVFKLALVIKGQTVGMVDSFRFLDTTINKNLKWEDKLTSIAKKAQQLLFFFRHLRKFGVSRKIVIHFYRAVIESVLTFSITVWYGSASVHDKNLLDGIVGVASKLTGCELPSLESLYITRTQRKVRCLTSDQHYPAHHLLQCLPAEKRFTTIKTRTSRFKNSFYPKAVQIMSSVPSTTIQWYSDWPSVSWPLAALSVPENHFTLLLVTWLVLSYF